MIKIVCFVETTEDISYSIDEGDSADGSLRTRSVSQARFTLKTFSVPKGAETIGELLATTGRRCRLIIED